MKDKLQPIHVLLVLIMMFFLTSCNPAKDVPLGAVVAALLFCPEDECDDVEVGRSTTQLPYTGSDIYDRWCIEVLFTRDGKKGKAAVEVLQIDPNAPVGLGDWLSMDPIYNTDCSIFE